jgi:hypothetical protein
LHHFLKVVNGITAKEALKSTYFRSDFIATVAFFLGTNLPTGSAVIKSISDVEVKRRMLLTNRIEVLYLVPVQNISMSIALSILTRTAHDGTFAIYLNRKLALHSVPYKVSVALPMKTDRNPTEAPTMSPTVFVAESHKPHGTSANTIGLIFGGVSVGILMLIMGCFYTIGFCKRKYKRK